MRALITRPRADATSLADQLARRGFEPVIEPMIEIVPRGDALPSLDAVQAVLCTSANGVRALAAASPRRDLALLAVGDASARAAREAGFARVDSAGGDVAALARLACERLRPEAGRLLHIAGSDIAGDLAVALGRRGFLVERAVLYDARAATALSRATARLIADGAIGLALFFSPRTAAIFARLASAAGVAAGLGATTALAISAAADTALAGLPFRRRLVAAAPTQAALLALADMAIAPGERLALSHPA